MLRHRVIGFLLMLALAAAVYGQELTPAISRTGENASQIGLYEKYEILVKLDNVSYINPFNPEEVDVRAYFTSPTGKSWTIYGFYDNYMGRNQWKVRFAPGEPGTWSYTLQVTTPRGVGSSPAYTFIAKTSVHKGWLHVSPENPHYLMHDSGAPFYGVSVFWPWKITEPGLVTLKASGCNLVGFWNVTYDDGTLIESISSGLGRYDQNKCERIDTILEWMEKRDMMMMLSIVPHDLFCLNMPGWAALWNSNPYKNICAVEEIYANETAWKYQEKQYRYIIARWGHSRGLGLWEIMNEINGTDGWAAGRIREAEEWTRKVHSFLKSNDPYNRPTTASASGGQWWPNGYAIFDLPNVHLYETGWPAKYDNNPLRSSLYTYHNVTRQMWNGFAKPAIMGEAGWLDSYGRFAGTSDEYAASYHNAIWASWASGLSCSPIWWAYDSRVFGPKVQERMKWFSRWTPRIDYASRAYAPASAHADNADAFAMSDGETAFGWMRDEWGRDISGRALQLTGLRDSVYAVEWYDTWKGVVLATHLRPCLNGMLYDEAPALAAATPDLAFAIKPAQGGTVPHRLGLLASPQQLYSDGMSQASLQCLIFDEQGRFCSQAANVVTFSLSGMGKLLGAASITASQGLALAAVGSDSSGSGLARIIVTSPGLLPDTVTIAMTDVQPVDNFEAYGTTANIDLFWNVRAGTAVNLSIEKSAIAAGAQGLRIDYTIGNGRPPYAGFFFRFPDTLKSAKYMRFWLGGDGSNRTLAILLNQYSSSYWQYQMTLPAAGGGWFEIPLTAFAANEGMAPVDLSQVSTLSFNILKGAGANGSGILYLDEITLANSAQTSGIAAPESAAPLSLQLRQNYPNPFNASTALSFDLPQRSHARVAVYNLRGQRIAMLNDAELPAGRHTLRWEAGESPSGTYFIALQTPDQTKYIKCALLR